jgi:type IV secretion system protein VirD4
MQLPPDDEIVMVAGTAPIRARKARYFEDKRLNERILPPPDPAKIATSARFDNWSSLDPLQPYAASVDFSTRTGEDKANASLRREPELPEHVEIVHERQEPSPEDEFRDLLGNDQDDAARQRQVLRRQLSGIARQASLNPNDGIEL